MTGEETKAFVRLRKVFCGLISERLLRACCAGKVVCAIRNAFMDLQIKNHAKKNEDASSIA